MPQTRDRDTLPHAEDRSSSSEKKRDPSSAAQRAAEFERVLRFLADSDDARLRELGADLREIGDRLAIPALPPEAQPEMSDAFIMSDRFAKAVTGCFRDATQRAVTDQLAQGHSVRGYIGDIEVQISPSPTRNHRQTGD